MHTTTPDMRADVAALARRHAEAAIATLVEELDSAEPRQRVRAALALLRLGGGRDSPRPKYGPTDRATPLRHLGDAELAAAIEWLKARIEPVPPPTRPAAPPSPPPGQNMANRAATSCPARHDAPAPAAAEPPLRSDPGAEPPPAEPPPPEPPPSPLAARSGTDSPRRDADPMSRRLLPGSHSAESAFRRRLPQPPDMEPPWPFAPEHAGPPYRRPRWG